MADYRKIKSDKSWNKVKLGSEPEIDITDLVLDYYLEYWQDIVKNFKLQKYLDMREMLHFALEKYLEECIKPGKFFVPLKYRHYLKAVHEELKENYIDLWHEYELDNEYAEALQDAYDWLVTLKKTMPKPPLTSKDLKVCLGCSEAFMLVTE